eukprot:TRINITY_DN12690_c0_g1_i1.p1 TRINITY_DN12690_c0_g1~~TRINITY_DN12690_c0_g1_i1.p1  ORF type:complete len:362 (-),score=75.09 TRINITY_DN12690_c0_g1_i1:462-1547(-)
MDDLPGDFAGEDFSLIGEGWEDCLQAPADSIMSLPGARGIGNPINIPVLQATPSTAQQKPVADGNKARRITVWNRQTKRKVSGNAAPMEKNLQEYLKKHPECEMYNGQDKHLTMEEKAQLIAEQNRIPIWNKAEGRKISGNAAPSEKNLSDYLTKHPHCEVYAGQDKAPGGWTKPASTPSSGASDFPSTASHNVAIPTNVTNIADVFDPANNDPFADMYKNMENDGVFSMSGLADSLPMDDATFMGMAMSGPEDGLSKSVNNYFAAARNSFDDQRFMGTQQRASKRAKSPGEGSDPQAMSPAQMIKLDMAARGAPGKQLGRSIEMVGGSLTEVLGMSFSLQDDDFLLMDEETLGSGIATDL